MKVKDLLKVSPEGTIIDISKDENGTTLYKGRNTKIPKEFLKKEILWLTNYTEDENIIMNINI